MSRQNNSFISHVITMKTTHNKNVKKAKKNIHFINFVASFILPQK
ncbi:hypothetical protein GMMP1_100038 [Candidatus Magnetomoraceae bacterium gMMP-1]